ncbi:MAG: RNA polymerase sigma factor [Candidatus Limnocylindria bacterium]
MVPPFDAFLEEHRETVYRFLVAAVGREEADDCFQETFLSALRAYRRLTDGSNLRGWVLTIAHRKAIDSHRARLRRRLATDAIARDVPAADGESRTPEEADVWADVRSLPPRQRMAVAHRYVSDLAYAEIGRLMGTSEEAARQNVHAGLKRLRSMDR